MPDPSPTEPRLPARFLLVWFAAALALALYGRAGLDDRRAGRCSLDGVEIRAVHRVDLVHGDAELARFCCTRCAAEWPDVPEGAWWRVRDELTGAPLDAREAVFVESRVVTVPTRQDRVHVFGEGSDALEHAAAFGGRIVANPLRRPLALQSPDSPAPDQTTRFPE